MVSVHQCYALLLRHGLIILDLLSSTVPSVKSAKFFYVFIKPQWHNELTKKIGNLEGNLSVSSVGTIITGKFVPDICNVQDKKYSGM